MPWTRLPAPVRNESLASFLRGHVQPYKIDVLVTCGGIRVTRARFLLKIPNSGIEIRTGDIVEIENPPSPACAAALDKAAKDKFRDYAASISLVGPFPRFWDDLLDRRPDTKRVVTRSLRGLLLSVRNADLPVRDILVAAHAYHTGYLDVRMEESDPATATVEYETLQAAIGSGALLLPPEMVRPRPLTGSPPTTPGPPARFIIRGCLVGRAVPFLQLLKATLGGHMAVIAPNYWDTVADLGGGTATAEYLQYDLLVRGPSRLKSRAAAVSAFRAAGLKFYDGTAVPSKNWDKWISAKTDAMFKAGTEFEFPSKEKFPTKAPGVSTVELLSTFHYYQEQFLTSPSVLPADRTAKLRADPTFEAKLRQRDPQVVDAVLEAIVKLLAERFPRYQANHPFPRWRRNLYPNWQDWMRSYNWTFTLDKAKGTIEFSGVRHVYEVRRPITDVSGGHVLLDLYPAPGSRLRPFVQLDLTDPKLFTTV